MIDLASRAVGGGVVAASDETFAEKENLVAAAAPTHTAHTFGHKGQVYDGWETRRRRGDLDGEDWAVVRLGLPGVVHRVVVDTAFFDGNHPVSAEVDTCWPSTARTAISSGSTVRGTRRPGLFPTSGASTGSSHSSSSTATGSASRSSNQRQRLIAVERSRRSVSVSRQSTWSGSGRSATIPCPCGSRRVRR